MKIGLILSQTPSYSETFFNSKITGLIEHGYIVKVFAQKKNKSFNLCEVITSPKIHKNIIIRLIKALFVFMSLIPYINRVFKFYIEEKKIKRTTIQILKNIYNNSHLLKTNLDWVDFGFATIALQSENIAKVIGAKMAVSCRGYDMDVYPLKYKNCFALLWETVDKVHVISNHMKTKALESGMKLNTEVSKITPAINIKQFQEKKQNIKLENLQFTTIARLHWIKGLIETLEALALLKEKFNISFKYIIIGDGSQYEELAYAIHQLNLENEVEIMGQLEHNKVINYLTKTDIYIQYSWSEGFCNAVLEAQAMGCLCVVSDGGALPENIIHQKTGWVAPKHNPKALAQTINDVLQLEAITKQNIKSAARQRVLDHFKIEDQIEAFKNFYL